MRIAESVLYFATFENNFIKVYKWEFLGNTLSVILVGGRGGGWAPPPEFYSER